MLNFICASLSCLTGYLGAGYIVIQTDNLVVYVTELMPYVYICNRQHNILMCERRVKNDY